MREREKEREKQGKGKETTTTSSPNHAVKIFARTKIRVAVPRKGVRVSREKFSWRWDSSPPPPTSHFFWLHPLFSARPPTTGVRLKRDLNENLLTGTIRARVGECERVARYTASFLLFPLSFSPVSFYDLFFLVPCVPFFRTFHRTPRGFPLPAWTMARFTEKLRRETD